jgi:hypothetical protein
MPTLGIQTLLVLTNNRRGIVLGDLDCIERGLVSPEDGDNMIVTSIQTLDLDGVTYW